MKLNDKVTWSSQSGSYSKTKVGTIVGVVPANKIITPLDTKYYFRNYNVALHELMFDGYGKRNHESYLVLVEQGKAKAKLYWPLVKNLRSVE